MQIIKFHIRKPWFMNAGKQFDWPSSCSQEGIGLAKWKLKGYLGRMVEVTDNKNCVYTAPLKTLFDFFEDNPQSKMWIKKMCIIIFPRSIFKIQEPDDGNPQESQQSLL